MQDKLSVLFFIAVVIVGLVVGYLLWHDQGGAIHTSDIDATQIESQVVTLPTDTVVNASSSNIISLLTKYTWIWEETLMNNDDSIVPATPGAFTLAFTDVGQVSGSTDCNSFSGGYTLTDTSITTGDLAMTRMYCPDTQEAAFMEMISTAQSVFFTEAEDLVLLLPYDSGSVIFSKQE